MFASGARNEERGMKSRDGGFYTICRATLQVLGAVLLLSMNIPYTASTPYMYNSSVEETECMELWRGTFEALLVASVRYGEEL